MPANFHQNSNGDLIAMYSEPVQGIGSRWISNVSERNKSIYESNPDLFFGDPVSATNDDISELKRLGIVGVYTRIK